MHQLHALSGGLAICPPQLEARQQPRIDELVERRRGVAPLREERQELEKQQEQKHLLRQEERKKLEQEQEKERKMWQEERKKLEQQQEQERKQRQQKQKEQ